MVSADDALATAVIDVADVTYRINGSTVLEGQSLVVNAGEVVAIVGGQATGKTSLLLIAIGALRPDQGRVRLAGLDPFALRPPDRRAHLRRSVGWWACRTAEAKLPVAMRVAASLPAVVVADEPQMIYGAGRPTLRDRIQHFATAGAAVLITTRPGLRTGLADAVVELE